MILRRLAEAINRQDWFVVFLELLIVVFGVYIGIYLGDIQAARQQMIETNVALEALESEMRSDLLRLDEVIAIQTNRVREQKELIELWSDETSDHAEVAPRLELVFRDNSTFFPNRSGYRAMQEGGYLAALPDENLRLTLARLFEREYNRQDQNAEFYDELGFDFSLFVLPTHWDRVSNRPLGNRADSLAALRSGMITVHDQGQFYFEFITGRVRPDIVSTLEMIDAYQEAN